MNCAKVKSFPLHPNRYSTAPDWVKMPFMVRQSCYVDVKSPNSRMLFSVFTSRPKRGLLLCVARHPAVTLTQNAPLSKAQSPGLSVSAQRTLRSCCLVIRFCLSSSRALGRCLVLGQRSRMNFFSYLVLTVPQPSSLHTSCRALFITPNEGVCQIRSAGKPQD